MEFSGAIEKYGVAAGDPDGATLICCQKDNSVTKAYWSWKLGVTVPTMPQ